jgi:hypothetical protein
VLSGLAVCALITALVAGMTGAWSPCGLSMVDTIGTALGDARRSATWLGCATFAVGAVVGGAITFGTVALAGRLIAGEGGSLRYVLAAGVALSGAIADWRGVKIAPQIRRQVPERWRWTLPLGLACGLYGILLGLGFTTFVLAFAVWALAGISLAVGSPLLGLLVGVGFGLGRALPVLWMAPSLRDGAGALRLEGMAADPRLWLGLRRLDALGLGLCAVCLGVAGAPAARAAVATLSRATDPSAAGGELAWQTPDGRGMLLRAGEVSALPGGYPALGQSSIAWQSGGQVTVVDRTSMAPKATFAVARLSALAVSDSWVVYRDQTADGTEGLVARSLLVPGVQRAVASAPRAGELGRPTLDGQTLVFSIDTPRHSLIQAVSLESGARSVLRSSASAALLNPALLHERLLYERVGRCAQQLRIGSPSSSRHDRVLLRLSSTVLRDPGYEPGYEHAYNRASVCRNRRAGHGGTVRLGATALANATAYVNEISGSLDRARVIAIRR